ncbi:MAG: P-II family nitrogen regulator [Nitrososphaerales archaeon]
MKRIDAVVPAEKLTNVNAALKEAGVSGVTVFDSKGRGQTPLEPRAAGRGAGTFIPEFNNNSSVVVVVKDSDAEKVVEAILKGASGGMAGEGKVFVTKIDNVVDIGTKKSGEGAL